MYKELENLISGLYGKEKTLLYNSGYHANVGISSALNQRGDVVFSDKLNHASIIDGMQLSAGKFFRFPHNDMEAFEKLLIRERENYKNAFIITESVFSMDGDIEDLRKIVELKKKYNCIMIVDEAHAFGVFGEKGLEIFDKIVAVVTSVGETIKGVFSDGNLGAARDKIQEIFGEKGVAVFDTFAGVFQKVVAAAGQFVGFVTTHIVPVVEQVLNVLITTVIPGIISGVQAAAPVVMEVFQAIADFIGGIIPIIGDFIAGIMPVISEVITFIQTYVLPIVSEVSTSLCSRFYRSLRKAYNS